jgi:hypothetical protein
LHLESDPARGEGGMGELGQTRAYCQRAGAGLKGSGPVC